MLRGLQCRLLILAYVGWLRVVQGGVIDENAEAITRRLNVVVQHIASECC